MFFWNYLAFCMIQQMLTVWPLVPQFSSIQSLSHVWLFAAPWTTARQASCPSLISQSLLKLMSIESVMTTIQPSHPLSSPSPPAFSLSQHQGLFQWISSLHQVAKVLEFQLQHQSFLQDWFPLELTSLILQSKGLSGVFSNTTVQKHQFFGAQLSLWSNSHPYMTTGKTIALTKQTFVGKVMSLLFSMLSRLVIAFIPRRKPMLLTP